jgi:leucyl aminopeptidase
METSFMEIKASISALHTLEADAIILSLFENTAPVGATHDIDVAMGGAIRELITAEDFTGKAGQVAVLYPRGVIPVKRIILVGLGEKEKLKLETIRRASANAIQKARDLKARHVASVVHGSENFSTETATEAVIEASLLAIYGYYQQKSKTPPEAFPQIFELVVSNSEDELAAVENGIKTAEAIASGVKVTRDMVNMPPNFCTPTYMAEVAQQIASEVGLKVQILEQAQMEALKMGALLAVSQGSDTPPRFIILEHNADKASELATIVLIGKGVTFDTGGYSIKGADGMEILCRPPII